MEAPRNIRQIGDIEDSLRLYIEDYVMTFMGKQKRRGAAALGALLGIQGETDGVPCVFIRGAVLAEEIAARTGIPVACHVVHRKLVKEMSGRLSGEVFPIQIYMRKPWEEEDNDGKSEL